MSVVDYSTTLKGRLNLETVNSAADNLKVMSFGDFVRSSQTYLRNKAPAASPYALATLQTIQLPDDAKAAHIIRAYARAGTGTLGPSAAQADGATPSATQCAVTGSGDIAFLATDAYTSVDVIYEPEKVDIYEVILPVASNAVTLPTKFGGVVLVMEVESLVGTLVSKMIVLKPGTSVSTGQAALNLAKTVLNFASADAVTSARIKFGTACASDLDILLESTASVP